MALDSRDSRLWNCIEDGDGPALEELLATGISLTYHFDDGWAPLHHAVDVESDAYSQVREPRDLRVIAPLLARGVDVNALCYRSETASPRTPLDVAETYGNEIAADAIRRAGGRTGRGMPGRVIYPSLAPGDERNARPEGSRIAMNRVDLAAALARAGISDSAYDLGGTERDGVYCLAVVPGGWAVWFSAHGRRVDAVRFATEDEACSHLLRKLTGDA